MPLLLKLLESLANLAGLETVTAEWESLLGAGCMERLPAGYLVNARRVAEAVPCRNTPSCERHHVIEELPDGALVAMCTDDDVCCRTFNISHADRICWRLDLEFIASYVAETLSLDGTPEPLGRDAWRLGTITHRRVPVFLSYASTPAGHVANAALYAADPDCDGVFLVQSPAADTHSIRSAAKAAHVRLGVLSDLVALDRNRRLSARQELTDLWPDIAKDPGRRVQSIGFPEGTEWRHVVVTLTRNGRLSIAHHTGNPNRFFTSNELGFLRADGSPKKCWDSLVQCADLGCIPYGIDTKSKSDARNRARDISNALQRAAGCAGFAFEDDKRAVKLSRRNHTAPGYWPRFKLRREEERFCGPRGNYQSREIDPERDGHEA